VHRERPTLPVVFCSSKLPNRGYLAEPQKSIREHVILDTIAVAPKPQVLPPPLPLLP